MPKYPIVRHWVFRASSFIPSLGLSCFVIQLSFTKAQDVAEKRLELKEESEKGRLARVKEKRRYKRFDLFATLAVLGTLAVLLFECIFVFELYTRKFEPLERFFPAIEEPAAEAPEVDAPSAESPEADAPAAPELVEPLNPVG